MVYKQVKLLVAGDEQSVTIQPNEDHDGLHLVSKEVNDKHEFLLYLTPKEAQTLGSELIVFAQEVEDNIDK